MAVLYQTFLKSAQVYPDKTALVVHTTQEEISYNELHQRIEKLATYLNHELFVKPGDRIGLLMANTVEFVVSFFAIQLLGAIAVPMNIRLSAVELEHIALHSQMSGLLLSEEFLPACKPFLEQLSWYLDPESASVVNLPLERVLPNANLTANDMAVIIYTSGTTGKPKGVMLSHKNLLTDAELNAEIIEASESDVFISTSPLFHVFGLVNMMLTALLNGAKLVLVKKFHPKTTLEAIAQHRVTFLAAVPTMYQMMLSLLPSTDYDLSSLRVCHSGAAPMHEAVFESIEKHFGAPVQEGYGLTEASSIMTSNPLKGTRKPGSIGLPLPSLMVDIVDETHNVLPANELGELRMQGGTMMLGYYLNPEATKKRVVDGWLYTSDLGYKDDDGYLFLVGRSDDVINVGGVKVYPKEVEEILYRHEAIDSCAVKGEASEMYNQIVVAYVVLKKEYDASISDLQSFCRDYLAEYKIPKAINFVDEIPKSPSGKILRHQLKMQNQV